MEVGWRGKEQAIGTKREEDYAQSFHYYIMDVAWTAEFLIACR